MIRGILTVASATVSLSSLTFAQDRQAEPEIIPGIPTSALPPEGMCRVWLKDVPVSRQPAPTDCASAIRSRPRDAILLIGDPGKNARAPARSPVSSLPRNQLNDDLFNRRRNSNNLTAAERAVLQQPRPTGPSVAAQRTGQPAQPAPANAAAAVKAPDAKAAAVVKPPQ